MRIPPISRSTLSFFALALPLCGCDDPAPRVVEKTIAPKVDAPNRNDPVDVSAVDRLLSDEQREQLRQEEAQRRAAAATAESAEQTAAKIRSMLTFTLPDGWSEIEPAQFRDVNLRAGPNGELECYLTYLAGGGGGAKLNVDRWRGQFGLPESSEAEFAALPRTQLLLRDAVRVEMSGNLSAMNAAPKSDHTMIALFAEFPAFAMTLKLIGPTALVAAERAKFDALTASFAFQALGEAGSANSAEPAPKKDDAAKKADEPTAAGPFDATKVKWATPTGWVTGTGSSMRLVTYDVPGGAQIWVTPLSGGAGGLRANLDRWRKEMSLEPLTDEEFAALPNLRILGVETPWLDLKGSYAGMGGPTNLPAGSARMLAAACALPDALVTVKMVGPADVLEREISNFQAFCESLEVGR